MSISFNKIISGFCIPCRKGGANDEITEATGNRLPVTRSKFEGGHLGEIKSSLEKKDVNLNRRDSIKDFAVIFQEDPSSVIDPTLAKALPDAYRYLGDLGLKRCNRPGFSRRKFTPEELISGKNEIDEMRSRCLAMYEADKTLHTNILKDGGNIKNRSRFLQCVSAAATKNVYVDKNKLAFCGEHVDIMQALLIESGVPSAQLIPIDLIGSGTNHAILMHSTVDFPGKEALKEGEILDYLNINLAHCTVIDPWSVNKLKVFAPTDSVNDFINYCVDTMRGVNKNFKAETLTFLESSPE